MSIKKVTNFNFPVGEKQLSQDAYYTALAEANSGFFPFGENGIWHGGIHIDEAVLKKVGNDDKLYCMANGEVVAYRMDNIYRKIVYNDNVKLELPYRKQQKVAYFSTGFILVRHLLQMPKVTGSTETPPSITLYSLYMHQLDWYGYQKKKENSAEPVLAPHFWAVASGDVSADTKEVIKGSVIRKDGSKTEIVGLLLKGSKIRLSEKKGTTDWYKITSLSSGSLITTQGVSDELDDIQGYIWHKDVTPQPTGKSADTTIDYQVVGEDNDAIGKGKGKGEVKVKGITVYASANETKKLAYLPQTAVFEFEGQENDYGKISKITGCFVPEELKRENGGEDSPHQGYVKVASLSSLTFKPEKLDDIVVLKTPVPISKGDFIGYIGHNVSQQQRFNEPEESPLATEKRASDKKLPRLAHIELLTCDDLPAFITKTRALADKLPESEQTIILVEKEARLIAEPQPDGRLKNGLGIHFISDVDYYYVKIRPEYTLNIPLKYFDHSRVLPSIDFNTEIGNILKTIGINIPGMNSGERQYRLTQADKTRLVSDNQDTYSELTINDIPDIVEIVGDIPTFSLIGNISRFITIRFMPEKYYWIKSERVLYLGGESGQLNTSIDYWKKFPLSLDNLPAATENNTVYYPRTLSIDTLNQDNTLAVDENHVNWACVIAGNKYGLPIKGWVNIEKDAQAHIKRVTPWHWSGFNTIEEKATVGQFSQKLSRNRAAKLDLDDCTETMQALLRIFCQSKYIHELSDILPDVAKNKLREFLLLLQIGKKQPFTTQQFKNALRISWTAEQIGHLLLKYESEWYADEALSKWNEIDELFEEEKQQQKDIIEKLLTEHNITKPNEREYAFEKLDEAHENVKSNWQIEKEQRIKPSLWWKKVAEAQVTNNNQTTNANNSNTPKLTNLSSNGKVWFIHPVAMIDYFNVLSIVTYHIYHDGKIEKHFPKKITSGYEQKYKYVYHDKNNNEHEVCICEWHTTKKKRNGVTVSAPDLNDRNIIEYNDNVNEHDTQQRIKYANGNIKEYGRHPTNGLIWRLYKAMDLEIELIKMPNNMNYISEDNSIKIGYRFQDTERTYTNPEIFAAFIGALAEHGITMISGGSSFKEGSCFPSANHVNGASIDINYFYNSNDEKFLLAMKKFHFTTILVGNPNTVKERYKPYIPHYNKLIRLGGINGGDLHNSHVHYENFEFNINEV